MRMIVIVLLALMVPGVAIADCTKQLEQCDDVVEKCKKTVEAKNKAIELCNLALTQSIEQTKTQEVIIENQADKLSAWYRNPWVTIPLGIAAGVLIVEFAK